MGIERQVETDRTSRGHAALYMAPTIVQSALPIITLPIFTRVLTQADYGLWGIATAFGALVAGAAGLGLQVGYERNYFAATDETARARLLCSVVLFALGAQVVGLLVVLAAGSTVAARLLDAPERWPLLALAFGVSALGALKMFFLTTLRNEGRARTYVMFSVDELFLAAAVSLACVLWLRIGVAGLLVGPLVSAALVCVALAATFARQLASGVDRAQLRDTLAVSLPLAPRALIGAVGTQIDRLVLGAVGSLSDVGLYAIGQRMAQLVFAFATALQNVYQPHVYRMFFANAHPREIGSYLLPFAYATAAIAFGCIVFSREIVTLTAAPEFAPAALILAILAVHYGLMFFGKQPQLAFAKRTGLVSWLSAVGILLNAAGVYVGSRSGGEVGAAVGMLAAGVVSGGMALAVATRFAPIAYPWARTTVIFASLPVALLAAIVLREVRMPYLAELGIKVAAVGAYGLFGWRAGFFAAVRKQRESAAAAA